MINAMQQYLSISGYTGPGSQAAHPDLSCVPLSAFHLIMFIIMFSANIITQMFTNIISLA